tara:strand:+ start:499 stop:1098 length:600 start_codon:yes stop_codon:yes gene_type:complete
MPHELQALTISQAYEIHRLFSMTLSIFSSSKITNWCNGGTLLGQVRCEGMVLWDDDIDLAMPLEQRDILHSPEFLLKLSWLKLKLVRPSKLYYKIKYQDPRMKDIFIDICLIDENGLDLRKAKKNRQYLQDEIYPLREVKFSSIKYPVYIPNKSEEYLDRIFPRWQTSARIYNHKDNKRYIKITPLTPELNVPVKYHYR